MKKTAFFCFFLLSATFAFAQFEGTMLWSVKAEVTDPMLKAQMAAAQQQLSKPENRAQLQELEEKLNDPQFKAILDQSPEMKAIIEGQLAAMKNGGGGNVLENMLPKSIELKFKNGNTYSKVEGGAFPGEVLHLKDKQITYVIDPKNKTYYTSAENEEKTDLFKVTKTDEFATVLNYKCRKYVTEGLEQGQKITYSVWATTDIKDLDAKQFSKIKVGKTSSTGFMDKIEGVPLKMEGSLQQGRIVMEATSIKKESLPASLFQIPADYKEKKN